MAAEVSETITGIEGVFRSAGMEGMVRVKTKPLKRIVCRG